MQNVVLCSLFFETRSGLLCRRGVVARRALGAARGVIRGRGFTLSQAYAGACGVAGAPAGAAAAWRAAERCALGTWSALAPAGCPRPPEIRMVLALRRKPGA